MAVHDVRRDQRSLLRAAFKRDGYVLIEGALSADEIGRLTEAVDRVRGAERGGEDGPLHLLAFCGREGAFLELLDHPRTMQLIVDTLGSNVFMYHCHLDVHPPETPDLAPHWQPIPV
jgi:ectoine hydroxylase